MPAEFNGDESPSDVLKVVLDHFSQNQAPKMNARIVYEENIPYLTFHAAPSTAVDFVCRYRVDEMLLAIFPECERIFDHYADLGYFVGEGRESLIRVLAYTEMEGMLNRLILLHLHMFHENFEDAQFFASNTLFHALVKARQDPKDEKRVSRAMTKTVRAPLDRRVAYAAKKKREFLIGFLNTLPLMSIPIGAGRPVGSTKPEETKAKDAALFEAQVEQVIRKLRSKGAGKMPTKTAVAKEIGIGGWNRDSGTDNRLVAFSAKLKRLELNYDAISERVKLNK